MIEDQRSSSPTTSPPAIRIQKGVITTPKRLEILALKIAAATLPPEIDTKTTEALTVEGKAARKLMPRAKFGSNPGKK